MRNRFLAIGCAVALTAALATAAQAAPRDAGRSAAAPAAKSTVIDGQYIVVLKEGAEASAAADARASVAKAGGKVLVNYTSALNGFSAKLSARAASELGRDRNVAYVEADRTVHAMGDQNDPTWGLDRIDQRGNAPSRTYHYDRTGAGVNVYVIDSGIRISHTQFGGRAVRGFSSVNDGVGANDCDGHGTHVAGTIGGAKFGVAKGVKLIAVRVLDCNGSGSWSGVIAGIDWVTAHHKPGQPAVANMSLGGGESAAVNQAVAQSIADGVTYVVAAGNENSDACDVSPASTPPAITVASTTYDDRRSSFSNWGSCVDLFAPGSEVLSSSNVRDTSLDVLSGTSMASPHVAGVAATHLQAHPAKTPAQVANAIKNSATTGVVTDRRGSPNKLLYSKFGSTATSPPPGGGIVKQSGFESGAGLWRGSDKVIDCTDTAAAPAFAGECHAWLGGWGSDVTNRLSQTGIKLPPGSPKTLNYKLWISSNEGTGTAYDKFFVRVIVDGAVHTLQTFSNRQQGIGYVARSVSLAAFAGKTIELRFVSDEDSSVQTGFHIDNVTIN